MKKIIQAPLLLMLSLALFSTYAAQVPERYLTKRQLTPDQLKSIAAGCLPGGGFKYLDINNVRTRINTGGDMWWDFESAQYEIPKGSGKMSMFAASLWIGGIDVNDQLKLAALRYRQIGNDYWPGPLTIDGTASIAPEVCAQYDRIFPMTRAEVDEFLAWWEDKEAYPDYVIPKSILEWPAHGDVSLGQNFYLAPFFDRDGDGTYDPNAGDFPYYDLAGELCRSKVPGADGTGILADQVIKGDQTLWWVFNDKGNIHTETGGDAIGIEIRAQAFAFATNDEINNMTFYSYEIINRSTFTLRETFFSQWTDPDLGYSHDDYIGCDVIRGLGYAFNGVPVDGLGQAWAYGTQPPAVGIDFFQGPYMDLRTAGEPFYGQDLPSAFDEFGNLLPCDVIQNAVPEAINGVNFGDGIPGNERFGMRRFTFFNNTGMPPWGTDPDIAIEYYNYLRGIWKDGTKMIYGGLGHISAGGYGPPTDFLFPGDSDPCFWGTGFQPVSPAYWTEEVADRQPHDRRMLQTAGPFTLRPGAVNYITVGIPWARAASGGPWASVELLRIVDDKCQAMFDNCFQVVNGPNAPDLTFRELDQQLIVYISNRRTNDAGNNFNEAYKEFDWNIPEMYLKRSTSYSPIAPGNDTMVVVVTTDTILFDRYYRFEGYKVYQLAHSAVSVSDVRDPNLARLVFQSDLENHVSYLVNHYFDQALGTNVPRMEVQGRNEGITHSFILNLCAFTNAPLVNHKQYYFLALAYGFNEFERYTTDPAAQEPGVQSLNGQRRPFLAGRKNIRQYTAIPHKTVGTVRAVAQYGDGVEVTRIQGQGNAGNVLDWTQESIDALLAKAPADSGVLAGHPAYPILLNPTFEAGRGPVNVRVIDPLNVRAADFTLKFDSLYWQTKGNMSGVSGIIAGGDTAGRMVGTWRLIDHSTDEVFPASKSIFFENEQLFLDLGISITMQQPFNVGPFIVGRTPSADPTDPGYPIWMNVAPNNGFLEATMDFTDVTRQWLTGIPDVDGGGPLNWIRSGTTFDTDNSNNNDWDMRGVGAGNRPFDPESVFERVLGGTWAPYQMVAVNPQEPEFGTAPGTSLVSKSRINSLSGVRPLNISSVNLVLTSDKSKWTRSVILEMSNDPTLAEGGAAKFDSRRAPSVDKFGNRANPDDPPSTNPDDPNYISSTGMGWFPGFAFNIETGERLNIVFGENSWLVAENGRDMLWNPTSNVFNNGTYVFGGMHYIYIMASQSVAGTGMISDEPFAPAYDAGRWLYKHLSHRIAAQRRLVMGTAMWVNLPILVPEQELLSNDVTIRLRVGMPLARHFSHPPADPQHAAADTLNQNWPVFQFSTHAIATQTDDIAKAQSDLDLIRVVPNPYYAYSRYEQNQLDNRVKITNLPRRCVVSIYTINGTLVRRFDKDEDKTSIDWDLKNHAGIPISGGLYLIHIEAEGIGEKTVKWFGALRPVDLNAF